MVRGTAAMHMVRYNPSTSDAPDYLIAYECGFILRLFASPAKERFDFGSALDVQERIARTFSEASMPIPSDRLISALASGVLNHIVSVYFSVDFWTVLS
jgi:hypothetical protein